MPELPDIELYRSCLAPRVVGQRLGSFRLASPFLLRTVEPRPDAFVGRSVRGVERLGKRLEVAEARIAELEAQLAVQKPPKKPAA